MILLDADVLLIDQRYQRDRRYPRNRQVLDQLRLDGIPLGATAQVMLEVVGVLSFQYSPADVPRLFYQLPLQYGLAVVPDPQTHSGYAGCTVPELLAQMSLHMALDDAVQAIQIERFASFADCLLTWNAKHFAGKMSIPVLTPEDWWNQRAGSVP